MRTPNVCTDPTTHRRIVSSNPKALGASTSSRNSVQWPSAKTPQSFRLSFALFVLFVVNPLPKSAFRNLLSAHERPVYRRLLEIIGFEISPNSDRSSDFASPWGRGQGEGELFPFSTEPNIPIKNHKSSWNAHERPVYRRLLEIIGFEISPNFDRSCRFAPLGGEVRVRACLIQILVQILQFYTILHSAFYSLNHGNLTTYNQKLIYPLPPGAVHSRQFFYFS
jgi:hypothetical protein